MEKENFPLEWQIWSDKWIDVGIFWQQQLEKVGLKIEIDWLEAAIVNRYRGPLNWPGKLNGRKFLMTLPPDPKKKCVLITIETFENDEEIKNIVEALSKFIEYKPAYRYLDIRIAKAAAEKGKRVITYEWNGVGDLEERFLELSKNPYIYNLEKLDT
jgi:hypothetical protein